jgi:hypothetical protein
VPVSIRTFRGSVVLKVLLRAVLKFAEFCETVKPVKLARTRRERSFMFGKKSVAQFNESDAEEEVRKSL